MVVTRHRHHIVVIRRHTDVQAAVAGVDPLEGRALWWIEAAMIGLFRLRLFARLDSIMLIRQSRTGGALVGAHLRHQQAIHLDVVRQDIMRPALVTSPPSVLHAGIFRPNKAYWEVAFARRAIYCQFQIGTGDHLDPILRQGVDRLR